MKIFETKHVRTLLLVLTLLVVAGEFFTVYYAKKLRDAYSNSAARSWVGRPSLIENGDVWISVYRKANRHAFDPQSALHIRFSQDEGITWTSEDVFLDGYPVLGFPISAHYSDRIKVDVSEGILAKTPSGNVLLFVREEGPPQNGTYVWRSSDGGAHWTDEGKINNDNTLLMGGQVISVQADLYATFWVDENTDYEPPFKTVLYTSADDGKSWIHVSDLSSRGTAESALVYLGGNELLVVLADDIASEKTYLRRSNDRGKNWGELQDVADTLGALGRPKLQMFPDEPNRLYLYGRDYIKGLGGYTVLYYSDDKGVTWSKKFYPGVIAYPDTGYSTLLKRTDGNFYMLSYGGTAAWANIKEYIFGKSAIEEL